MNSAAMEPEPEDEEQQQQAAASAAVAEASGESAVAATCVDIAGHAVVADSTTLDVSGWGLTAVQVQEVAGALPQLLCLRELVLDGVPVSGSTPLHGDFKYGYGARSLDADLEILRALCEGLRVRPTLTSLSLKKCYLGPQALALLASLIKVIAAVKKIALSKNFLFGSKIKRTRMPYEAKIHDVDADQSGWSALCDAFPGSPVEELIVADVGMGVTGVTSLATAISSMAALNQLTVDSTGDMDNQRAYTLRTMTMVSVDNVVNGAQTNATIKEGAVASVDGRWGEVVLMFEKQGKTYT
eukprot:COSAG01_NODE_16678_length_1216_cov_0.967771_1_plen_298_part_10